MKLFRSILALALAAYPLVASSQTVLDERVNVQTVNSVRSFPEMRTKGDWETRAESIRNQVLVSCGLWPMPEKTALNAKIFGKVIRDGYSVEKVYFESYPGFFVAGNVYRPIGKGAGPFPAILNPHGHWDNGRMANEKEGSIAARCIHFAREGMIALTYDMAGYNDTFFLDHAVTDEKNPKFYERHRRFGTNATNLLWNINLMGLQTWNSIRALDFLESLPDVDKTRLACTGESGGGTQTFMLAAIDPRLTAVAPVVMVSHTMQGGCSCENAPGLRINHSNMEIAACAAPKPQILVGASGDWTRDTAKMEGPAIQNIYKLFGEQDKFRFTVFDFRHNYNQTSREAVYDFFNGVLKPVAPAGKETAYTKEPDQDLRVFPGGKLPAGAKSESALISYVIAQTKTELAQMRPSNRKALSTYKQAMLPAWKQTLQVSLNDPVIEQSIYLKSAPTYTQEKLMLGRKGKGDRIPALLFTPTEKPQRRAVILVHPGGMAAFLGKDSVPKGIAQMLLDKNIPVLMLDTFLTGEMENHEISNARVQAELFFTTYNVTDTQARVQDLITAATFLKKKRHGGDILACGFGRAGLWTLLAAPAMDGIISDFAQVDLSSDQELLAPDLFVPGLRKLGGFETCTLLAAPNPLYVYNARSHFSAETLNLLYSGNRNPVHVSSGESSQESLAAWIDGLK